ncbi:hypothetical protein KDL01_03025 [Actinospica durhamensis]|uniref:DUF4232 domain-containing protein n=1 Tax=Actinospica durhamensis TaxID=1508375 RepID=A0A941ILW8_9ACTN|nr:hypothetical protein [Actinospica durhamensis]MBR7832214.1 hypothetical protein [Actinospica durhamensis]
MHGLRSARRGIRAAAATATATLVLCWPTSATAALAASGPAAATPTSTALPSCDTSGLQATQDHVGTVAEVSSIDEMDTVTLTIQNSGATCSGLGAALYLQTVPNKVTLVWPRIFWRIDGGSWMAAQVGSVSCQPPPSGPTDSCILATLPEFPPLESGTTKLAVALEFTSWNDANYSFTGSIVPNDDGNDFNVDEFGPGSTNDWALECATCINTGTSILPPGSSGGGSHPSPTPTKGRGSTGGTSSGSGGSAGPSAPHPSTTSARATHSTTPSASASAPATAATGDAPGPTAPGPAKTLGPADAQLASSSHNNPLPTAFGAITALLIVLGATSLLLRRRLRRVAADSREPGESRD